MNLIDKLEHIAPHDLLHRPETRLGSAILMIVAGVWGFAEIADEVLEQETRAFDVAILRFFREGPGYADMIGPQWVETAARELTVLGGYSVGVLLVLIVLGYLLLARHFRQALIILLASGGGVAAAQIFKGLFERARPDIVPRLIEVQTLSFPSGHATASAVIYLTLGVLLARFTRNRLLTIYVMGAACLLTLLVGWTRVALGVHYPTDVLAGWTLGLSWSLFSWLLVNFWENWKQRNLLMQSRAQEDEESAPQGSRSPLTTQEEQPS